MSFDGPTLQDPSTYYNSLNQGLAGLAGANPVTMGIGAVVVLAAVVLAVVLAGRGSAAATAATATTATTGISSGAGLVETIMWGLLLFLVVINGLHYMFDVDITTSVAGLFQRVPEVDIALRTPTASLPPVPEITWSKQVYHVPGNKYTYSDAQALCGAYDGRLATYEEVEAAQAAGGEWCSYGWSADQQALFPTQKSTYDALQQIPGHEHDCGRQGVNGGYIANPQVEFGANCYGYKPEMTAAEQAQMSSQSPYPLTHEQLQIDEKEAQYRQQLASIPVAPFSPQAWSQV